MRPHHFVFSSSALIHPQRYSGAGSPRSLHGIGFSLITSSNPVSLVLPRVHDQALRPRCLLGLCPILLCLSFLFWVLIHSAECSIATGGLTLLPGRSVIDPIVTNSSRGDPFLQLSLGDNNARKARNEACATSAQRLGSLDGACETGGEQVGFMARSWESFCEHVCFLIRGGAVVKLDYASLDELAYQVVPDVDVLRPAVYSRAVGEVDRSLVVAVQARLWLTRSQLFQHPPQPDRFLCRLADSNILGLGR